MSKPTDFSKLKVYSTVVRYPPENKDEEDFISKEDIKERYDNRIDELKEEIHDFEHLMASASRELNRGDINKTEYEIRMKLDRIILHREIQISECKRFRGSLGQ